MTTSLTLLDRLENRQDDEAWRELIDLYVPLIRGWLRMLHVSNPEAEDLTQEVLSVVVQELPEFRHNRRQGAFRTWLRKITVNRVHEHWRRRGETVLPGHTMAALEQLEDPHSDLSLLWDREHDVHVMSRLLAMVCKECRPGVWRAFERHVLDGECVDRVAAELQTTPNAVLIAKSRVLRRLREHARGFLGND